jgi:hypothetical protein
MTSFINFYYFLNRVQNSKKTQNFETDVVNLLEKRK